ncbi:TetR/AcrR family transcriptional regulator [Novosphingobium sp.]|uniref:TetR/AcrR family transcriptional regulator n=1 Tax=Novosphingobium sp. TaxID=1874826 RepID=UPI00333E2CCB
MQQTDAAVAQVPDLIMPERTSGYTKGHDTREMILRTALAILIDEGWHAMSMRRVAAACAIKLGNLTYHYPTREDLVRALLDAVTAAYEHEFDAFLRQEGLTPAQRLERYCTLVLDDIPALKTTRLFPELWALSNHDAFVHDRMHELYARARAPLNDIIADMRPDLARGICETLALFISFAMEGSTVFAGHGKPFTGQMGMIKQIALRGFADLVRDYRPAAC